MAGDAQKAGDRVIEVLNAEVKRLDRADYRAVLEGIATHIEMALDALDREELSEAEEEEDEGGSDA